MRKNTPILTELERIALEDGYRNGKAHCFRQRCKLILLKAEGRYSDDVAAILGMSYVSVNTWVKRFNNEKLEGLKTKPGQGRKPKAVLNKEEDEETLRKSIEEHRQKIDLAQEFFEAQSGKYPSKIAFRAFLKVLAQDTNA